MRIDTTTRDQDLIKMYKAGANAAECGRKFKITRERVRQILDAYGVERNEHRYYNWTKDPNNYLGRIRSLYHAGQSLTDAHRAVLGTSTLHWHPSPDDRRLHRIARFWKLVDWEGRSNEECWPWLGTAIRNGYPCFDYGGQHYMQRVLYKLTRGQWPKKRILRVEECRNLKCANPNHIYDGCANPRTYRISATMDSSAV